MKIAIAGCAGRMGKELIREALDMPGLELVAGSVKAGAPEAGRDLGEIANRPLLGIKATSDPAGLFAHADAVIDFTTPDLCLRLAALAARHKKILISGTTGLTSAQLTELELHAEKAVILWSPNTSMAVNLLTRLVEQAATILGEDYDIEILEMHHRHKVDAPSGTALALAAAAARGRDIDLEKCSIRSRDGHTGPRPTGEIGFATLRGGDVVGEHKVIFAGAGERLEIGHIATSRAIFARGALKAALWSQGKSPGFYTMRDVVG